VVSDAYFGLNKTAFFVERPEFRRIVGVAFSITANHRTGSAQGRIVYGGFRDGSGKIVTCVNGRFDGLLGGYSGRISTIGAFQCGNVAGGDIRQQRLALGAKMEFGSHSVRYTLVIIF
jgi:hypothetical protein